MKSNTHRTPRNSLRSPIHLLVAVARLATALGFSRQIITLLLSRGLMPREYRRLKVYKPTKHDVFVATYAKSGTNWAMQICQQIASRGGAEFDHIHDLVCWPESRFPEVVGFDDPTPQQTSPTGLRVIKTHLPTTSVPYSPDAVYVTVIRDPKDVLVSAYYFALGLLGIRHKVSPEQWLDLCLDKLLLVNRWAEHTAGFWAWRDRPNVFVRTFYQLKADRTGAIQEIARIMGVELSEAEFDAVAERSSFPYMKAHESQFAPPNSPLRPSQSPAQMIRSGKAGESREWMTGDIRSRLDTVFRRELKLIGSDFPYDEHFGERSSEKSSSGS